jgi:hypothetical protein
MPRPITIYFAATLLGISVFGQEPSSRFDALKQALALSDSQLEQLQRNLLKPPSANVQDSAVIAGAPPGSFFGGGRVDIYTPNARRSLAIRTNARVEEQRQLLYDSQRTKLDAIAKIFENGKVASLAIRLGLVTERDWGGPICFDPILSYGSHNGDADELALTQTQMEQFRLMEHDTKPLWLLAKEYDAQSLNPGPNSGGTTPSPAQAKSALDKLRADVIAVLNDTQWTILAEFQNNLLLANQAVELGLTPRPPRGEPLCQ